MVEARRSVPYAMAPSAAAAERACTDVRNGHALDFGAVINVRRWDELSDDDYSNWRSLWQAARERPELSPAGRLYRHMREGLSHVRRALWRRRLRDRRGGRDGGDAESTPHPDGLVPLRSKG